MTNLEYISSSPELFIEFIKSIKDDQSAPIWESDFASFDTDNILFQNWLYKWIKASRPEISEGQVWSIRKIQKHSSALVADKYQKINWQTKDKDELIEIKAVLKDNSGSIKVVYQSLSSNSSLQIISQEELLSNTFLLKTVEDLTSLHKVSSVDTEEKYSLALEWSKIYTLGELCSLNYQDLLHISDLYQENSRNLDPKETVESLIELSNLKEYRWMSKSNLLDTYNNYQREMKKMDLSSSALKSLEEEYPKVRTIHQLCNFTYDEIVHLKNLRSDDIWKIIDKLKELSNNEKYDWISDSLLIKTYKKALGINKDEDASSSDLEKLKRSIEEMFY